VRETWIERDGEVGDARRIYRVDAARGTSRLLVNDAPLVEQLVAAPDARRAVGVFASGEPAQRELGVLDLETGRIARLAQLQSGDELGTHPALAYAAEVAPLPIAQVIGSSSVPA